jgi:hypothetical protein
MYQNALNKGRIKQMKIKISILSILILLGIASCYKTPEYPVVPFIEFDSYSVSGIYTIGTVENLRISFTDGDGDLGLVSNNDTVNINSLVVSCVNYPTLTYISSIPRIPSKGTSKGISGTIDIKLNSLITELGCSLGFDSLGTTFKVPTDTLRFNVFIKDRAGNQSNTIVTPGLVIQCP